MKKKLLLLMCVFIIISCKKQDIQQQNTLNTKEKKASQISSAGDGQWDLLGYGYDPTKEFGNSSSSRFKIIDIAKLNNETTDRVETDYSKVQTGLLSYGENAETFSSDLSANVSATAGFKLFKSSLTASFTNSNALSSKWIYANYSLIIQQKRVKIPPLPSLLKNYLTSSFEADLQTLTPAEIVAAYGTHVLTDAILGAKLEVRYQSETSSANRSEAAKFGISASVGQVFSVTANLEQNSSYSNTNFSQSIYYKTVGGDPAKKLVGNFQINANTPTINVDDWRSSSSVDNAELISIGSNGLIPIYSLIDDPTKKAALQTYINTYFNNYSVELTPDPIFQFYKGPDRNHLTSSNENAVAGLSGWRYDGADFKAFLKPVSGTVPIYMFYNGSDRDHYISKNRNATYGFNNWEYQGIDFYAYSSQVEGTIPIYEYYHSSDRDHFVTANPNISTLYPAWQKLGIAFYAFPR